MTISRSWSRPMRGRPTLARIGQEDAYLGSDAFKAALVEERELYKPFVAAFASQGSR